MKGKAALWTSAALLAVGAALIALNGHDGILRSIAMTGGAMFLLPAVINMALLVKAGRSRAVNTAPHAKAALTIGWISSVGGLGLGLAMLLSPEWFESLLVLIFALAMIAGGCWLFYTVVRAYRPIIFPGWFYIPPAALIAAGLVVLLSPLRDDVATTVMITGIALVTLAVTTVLELAAVRAFNRRQASQSAQNITENDEN